MLSDRPNQVVYRQIVDQMAREKAYRDEIVSDALYSGLSRQIQDTRKARGWSQANLARQAGLYRSRICEIEDPSSQLNLTLKTLKQLASGLDAGLLVRFVPYSEIVNRMFESRGSLAVPDFEHDTGFFS